MSVDGGLDLTCRLTPNLLTWRDGELLIMSVDGGLGLTCRLTPTY